MDKDLERFRSYEVFKHYVKKRFSLRLLHQKGEQSFVRRMYVKSMACILELSMRRAYEKPLLLVALAVCICI